MFVTLDGPTTTDELISVLQILDEKDARASFFLPGSWVTRHPIATRWLVTQGHFLGNRGFATTPFADLDGKKLRSSIRRAERALRAVGANPRPFLRAPEGEVDLKVLRAAGRLGYRSVKWSQRPGHAASSNIARAVVEDAQPGWIVSLQLSLPSHRAALPAIIDGLRRRGFSLSPLEALAGAPAIRGDRALELGSSGRPVRYLEERLSSISYPVGEIDGTFAEPTLHAVVAFEKVNGLKRDGIVTPREMELIATSPPPDAPEREARDFVDIDISRQVLFDVRDGRVVQTIAISSGSGERYRSRGELKKARTPRGHFEILWKIPGWHKSPLGRLFYPAYFHEAGYAIHGSTSVPPYPASHGCIRVPMHLADPLYNRLTVGTKVFVHD